MAEPLPSELAGLDVVVATERDGAGEALIRILQRGRATVRHLWPLPDRLPAEADALFCDLVADLPARLPWVPGEARAALVVLLPARVDLALLRAVAAEAVLQRPYADEAVLAALLVARSQFLYACRLRSRIEKLDEALRATRSVERAKAILMSARRIGEDEAYRFMRQQAMARRVSVGAVAAAIVDAHELLD